MKLCYLLDDAFDRLYNDISLNLEHYSESNSWLNEYFQGEEFFETSSVEVDKFTPYISDTLGTNEDKASEDLINVRLIHSAFKRLTPWQASNQNMWTYLCHADENCYQYIQHRWLTTPRDNTVRTRFFASDADSLRNDNALSRLWWYGYLTYEEGAQNPYYLTEILLTNETICTDVIDTLNRTDHSRIKGVLLAIKEFLDSLESNVGVTNYVRAANRYMNRYAAVTRLDFLSPEEIKDIYLERLITEWKNDR